MFEYGMLVEMGRHKETEFGDIQPASEIRHQHHLFLKRLFLPRSARVRRFSRYEASPHIPEHYPFRVQTQLIHMPTALPTPPHIQFIQLELMK